MPCISHINTQTYIQKKRSEGLDFKHKIINLMDIYKGNKRTYNMFQNKLLRHLELSKLENQKSKDLYLEIQSYYLNKPTKPRYILIEFEYGKSGHSSVMFLYPNRIEFFDPSGFTKENPLAPSRLKQLTGIRGTTLSDYIIFNLFRSINSKIKVQIYESNLNSELGECTLLSLAVSTLRYNNSFLSFNNFQNILDELTGTLKSNKSRKEKIKFLKDLKSGRSNHKTPLQPNRPRKTPLTLQTLKPSALDIVQKKISKKFHGKSYKGTVVRFRKPYFHIIYNNGNRENLTLKEVVGFMI
jgi:hypothetical protein